MAQRKDDTQQLIRMLMSTMELQAERIAELEREFEWQRKYFEADHFRLSSTLKIPKVKRK